MHTYRISASAFFTVVLSSALAFTLACGSLFAAYHDEIPDAVGLAAWLRAMNVHAAWELGYTGDGVVLAVVDNAVSTYHNSYKDNVVYSHDYSSQNRPTSTATDPTKGSMYHGTFVASCAAGYDTSKKVFGTAYNVDVMGFKTATENGTFGTDTIRKSLQDCLSNEIHPNVINNSYGFSTGFAVTGYTSNGLFKNLQDSGCIMLYAAGNNRNKGVSAFSNGNVWNSKDAGKEELQASPYTISVAALNSNYNTYYSANSYATFSCYGASTFVSAPGTAIKGAKPTTETDATTYASGNGTSFASPLVAGVVALAVEAAKDSAGITLDTRMVKHLLASTSKRVGDPNATGSLVAWQTNAAGYSFSHSYGFGIPDAEALVKAAEQIQGITEQTIMTCKISSNGTITPRSGMNLRYAASLSRTTKAATAPTPAEDEPLLDDACLYTCGEAVPTDETALTPSNALSPSAYQIIATGTDTPSCDPVYRKAFVVDEATFSTAGVTSQPLEEVVLTIGLSHLVTGDLRIELYHTTDADQNGSFEDAEDILTTSVLCFEDVDMENDEALFYSDGYKSVLETGSLTWSFSSNAFWGEDPSGLWEVMVYDAYPRIDPDTQEPLYSVQVNESQVELTFLMGELQKDTPIPSVPEPSTVVLLVLGSLFVCVKYRKGRAASKI